jgi:hypothetical protein
VSLMNKDTKDLFIQELITDVMAGWEIYHILSCSLLLAFVSMFVQYYMLATVTM